MKYYGTKNDKDYGFYDENFDMAVELTDEQWLGLLEEQEQGKTIILFEDEVIAVDENEYEYTQDGNYWEKLTDEEAELKQRRRENTAKAAEIQQQIDELDKKRIRALCEPGLKDSETTWVEFYTAQVVELRNQLKSLS
jgi:hypothetical protein